jgi:aspartate ammonia-lyase
MSDMRTEHDLLGDREIPSRRYYGIQTQRALENFPIIGVPISHLPEFIRAFAWVKKAAAFANEELGLLPAKIASAICRTCEEMIEGRFMEELVVDLMQGGGGTSHVFSGQKTAHSWCGFLNQLVCLRRWKPCGAPRNP